ncbi:hypothetical protein BXZ70DRAFT_705001 [Cristinia sonorae]|uniref:DUF6534 domain-containing protein n=1 Tax=Cristinia sonorae TaxID=1940300 RepID=A0A8K0UD84_9AGAR|nr:hypothetical protein BXZ70DRAFT_705001 [Cristinia sonorae]
MDLASNPGEEVMGACFLMYLLTFILFGIFLSQVYHYAMDRDNSDPWYLKVNVAIILVVEILHSALQIHFIYFYAIVSAKNPPDDLIHIVWSSPAQLACEATIILLVHWFYIRRIWILSGNNIVVVGVLIGLLVARTGFSTSSVILTTKFNRWDTFRSRAKFAAICSCALLATADFATTSTMIFYLRRSQNRSRHASTNRLIHLLMVYVVNTGFIALLCSVSVLVTFKVKPNTLTFAGFIGLSCKLNANSLMGSLYMRSHLRDRPVPRYNPENRSYIGEAIKVIQSIPTVMPQRVIVFRPSPTRPIEIYQETSMIEMVEAQPVPGQIKSLPSTTVRAMAAG